MFLRRNVAGQVFVLPGALLAIADGSAVTTGSVTVVKDGTSAAGAGTLTHVASGCFSYQPTQSETDCAILGFILTGTGAAPVCGSIRTTNADPDDGTDLGLTNLDAAVSTRSTFAGGPVASVTGDIGGNVTGSVGGNVGGSVLGGVGGNVAGKVLGGGSGTIAGIGAWALGGSGAALSTFDPTTDPVTLAADQSGVTALGGVDVTGSAFDANIVSQDGEPLTRTLQAGGTTSITLAADDGADVDWLVYTTGGTGEGQLMLITARVGDVATVELFPGGGTPAATDDDTTYQSMPPGHAPRVPGGVWEELRSGHTTEGSFGEVFGSLVSGDDVADAVLSRSVANVEDSAGVYSLCYLVLAATEASRSGSTLQVNKTDGSTSFATRTLTTSAVDPVTGVS